MLLVRALENRKKMEDQKKVELQILKEVRRPAEDMILKDALPLPTLNRIPGLKVPGTAFANLLMVREFLHNFGETLHFDTDKIPSLNSLQLGLINHNRESEQHLLSVVQHLLVCAIHDPGTLHCKEAVTVLGQHVKDAPITNDSLTEALHLYFMALDKECAMYQWVTEKPFLALNPTQKSEILAFLCNELLCSRAVVRQVDTSIETVNTLRKDKWLAEGELRKLRGIQQGRQRKAILKQELENNASNNASVNSGSMTTTVTPANNATPNNKESEEGSSKAETASDAGDKASKNGQDEEEEDGANDSGNESDDPQEGENLDEEEDCEPSLTNEELEKKIDKLAKQQAQFQSKVAKASSSIRAVMLGQDRFRRRYWLLPLAGGVFVEAMESCEQDGMGDFLATDYMADEDEDSSSEDSSLSKVAIKKERESPPLDTEEGEEDGKLLREETLDKEAEIGEEGVLVMDIKEETKTEEKNDEKKSAEAEGEENMDKKVEAKAEETSTDKDSVSVAPTTSAATLSAMTTSTTALPAATVTVPKSKSPVTAEPTLEQSWMLHSPFFASIIAGNMLFNNGPFPSSSASPGPNPPLGAAANKEGPASSALLGGFPTVSAEQMLKNLAQKRPKPWFSILPRIPCDEESVARLPGSKEDEDDLEDEVVLLGAGYGGRVVSIVETEDTTNQYDKPQPVPPEYLRGWWRLTDASQLRTLMGALHSNGIREKALLKQLEKNFNYGMAACIPNSQQDVGLEITDLDREVSEKHGGAPPPDYEDQWSLEVALRVDLTILSQVEALEHKVLGASMQVKGWRPPPKASDDSSQVYRPSCVLLHKKLLSSDDDEEEDSNASPGSGTPSPGSKEKPQSKDSTEDATSGEPLEVTPVADNLDSSIPSPSKEVATEERKDSKVVAEGKEDFVPVENFVNPIEVAKERLLNLEVAIERRYIRPPLGTSGNCLPQTGGGGGNKSDEENGASSSNSGVGGAAGTTEEEEVVVPPGLARWREAVAICQTAAQLAMCLSHLESSIAWDRSIMKASCQFCHSGDNEEMLLLCDGCDKGYHTYCFKPKMDRIPDGDWYCYECLNKTQDKKVCVLCGKEGKLIHCDACPKVFHLTCLEPPLSKAPKGKWTCSGCSKHSRKKGRPWKEPKEAASKESKDGSKKNEAGAATPPTAPTKASKGSERREKNKSQVLKDLAACRQILEELEQHKDAWPFLLPVNTKQFPSYRKFIKKPMDVSTMRSKLDSNQYKTKDEFALDARLIFDNCETFNEDDSPVGQAGHNMRNFFERRWEELTS